MAFILVVILTGTFSLLWLRHEIYLKATRAKLLEKELADLTHASQRADLYIAHLQNQWSSAPASVSPKQIIWVALQSEPITSTTLALNNR